MRSTFTKKYNKHRTFLTFILVFVIIAGIFRKQVVDVLGKVMDYSLEYVAKKAIEGFVPVDIKNEVITEIVVMGEPETEQSTEQPTEQSTEPSTESSMENESETEPTQNNEPLEPSIIQVAAGVYGMDKLKNYDFVLKNFYVVPSSTSLTKEKLNLEQIFNVDLTIEKKQDVPQILIFHTHGNEMFADSAVNGKSIVDVGAYLSEILRNEYGYNVMHLTDSFDMINGVLDRSEAYTHANNKLDKILEAFPSIEVVIDLHRDGVSEDRHLVTEINGKQTAQIMLFNGISYTKAQGELTNLPNPYITENLAMTYKMYLLGEMMYPDFIRCIYIEGYRYCLYHRPKSMLIEAGAQTNTYEEVCNAMEPLAKMLHRELSYE